MSILVTPDTKILIQGITGSFGARHAKLSLEYGTKVVAGVTPGKGGQLFEGKVPIFDTVAQAVGQTGATASAILSRPRSPRTPSWSVWMPKSSWPLPSLKAFRSMTW